MSFTVDHAFELVKSAHERGRLAHAFLISGPKGVGKSQLVARIIQCINGSGDGGFDLFGEAVAVQTPELDEMESELVRLVRPQSKSRRIRVDQIRELEKSLWVAAPTGKWKVGVVLEADRMMTEAENAFLKTLEEPPAQSLLILLTDNPQGLLPTILSRCVRMPLIGDARERGEGEQALLGMLRQGSRDFGTMTGALSLKASFSVLLDERKTAILKSAEEALKEEEAAYKNAIEGDWLKRREEQMKAAGESEYLTERAAMMDLLVAWVADILRQKAGAGGLDFPEAAKETAELAGKEEWASLLARAEALEKLRNTLETNAQEQLALEVGFLKAFG